MAGTGAGALVPPRHIEQPSHGQRRPSEDTSPPRYHRITSSLRLGSALSAGVSSADLNSYAVHTWAGTRPMACTSNERSGLWAGGCCGGPQTAAWAAPQALQAGPGWGVEARPPIAGSGLCVPSTGTHGPLALESMRCN